MPDGPSMSRNQVVLPLSTLHLELFVTSRKNRARVSRILQKVHRIARRLTQDGGGKGPGSSWSTPSHRTQGSMTPDSPGCEAPRRSVGRACILPESGPQANHHPANLERSGIREDCGPARATYFQTGACLRGTVANASLDQI